MTRRIIGLLIILLPALLGACSSGENYEPFTPLSKVTVSPEREAAVQAALNGDAPVIQPTAAAPDFTLDEPVDEPSFDEDSFFAEVGSGSGTAKGIPTEPAPFEAEPAATLPVPTATPAPTPTKAYDPNIMMYNTLENGLRTYTLQDGDDLICLARRFDIQLSQLLTQNQLENPESVQTGDVIVLPRNSSPWSVMDGYGNRTLIKHPGEYITNAGDTLFSIACQYGSVLPEDIAVRNKLVLGEPLEAGIPIVIP